MITTPVVLCVDILWLRVARYRTPLDRYLPHHCDCAAPHAHAHCDTVGCVRFWVLRSSADVPGSRIAAVTGVYLILTGPDVRLPPLPIQANAPPRYVPRRNTPRTPPPLDTRSYHRDPTATYRSLPMLNG